MTRRANKKDETHKQSVAEQWVERAGGTRIADISDSKLAGADELVSIHGLLVMLEYKTTTSTNPDVIQRMLTNRERLTLKNVRLGKADHCYAIITSYQDLVLLRERLFAATIMEEEIKS